ncbi:MAG: glycoside hydrolase family 3 C-terminal domain-containing protein [Eubacteriales bacterium]|nr:glycoside hydrolase family 3 C-terminal domain-containing protein [Eubacteriales bacterium]
MVNFLAGLLGPFVTSLGVSEADLLSYLTQLQGYITGILVAIVALIVILIAAHWAKKGFRHVIRWEAVMAFFVAILVMVNSICYGPMYANVSGFLNASKADLTEETVKQSEDIIKRIGEEGIVLVKNNGLLPLTEEKKSLNVFGWDSVKPIFGGTGSAGSHTGDSVGILKSLQDAGFATNETLTKLYTDYAQERPTISMQAQDWTLPEPTVDSYTDDLMNEAKDFSDTAVIVIGRSGGEGADLPKDMNAVIHGTYNPGLQVSAAPANWRYMNAHYTNNGNYDDFEEGESYLELSVTEEQMVEKVCSEFDNVIVVINANNTMELGWVDEYEQIGAVLLAPGAGQTGFAALGEILNGSVNPSGKTADTYVKDLTRTPYYYNVGNFSYMNADDLKQKFAAADGAYEGNIAFVNYVEGIYVGYKFFETAAVDGLMKYENYVQYPFGYGLSYTTFEKSMENFKDNGDTVSFDVKVTNTGDVAGKDVVEVYFTPPYTNGGIEKAAVNLIQFEKTGEIKPGESETVSFELAKEDMASYDSEGLKLQGGGYILEAGEYVISVRSDSHTVIAEEAFEVDDDIDYSTEGRSTDKIAATNQFEEYSRGDFVQLSRKDKFANYMEAISAPAKEAYNLSDELRAAVTANAFGSYDPRDYDNADDEMPTSGAENGLTLYDLKGVDIDDAKWDTLLDQMTFAEMVNLVNVGGWQTVEVASVGKIATSDCDGPAGLNNFVTKTYGTSYPSEVLLAQCWSKQLAYEVGQSMGQEFADAKNFGWYGPAMNTHRSAFAGRNFEYYSEDGVLAGYLAMNQVNGAAEKGVYAYIKHLALNDQETNREAFLMTFASEQAIRETYLKPFEICIKGFKGVSQAVMSSYNWIGTKPSCANNDLLQTVLRGEWGFKGMVITDYAGSYGYMISDHAVRNGNDLMLGYGSASSTQFPIESATVTKALRTSSKNIMYTIVNSGYYADGNPVGGMSNMDKLFLKVNVGCGVVIALIAILVLVRYFLKKKKAAKTENAK